MRNDRKLEVANDVASTESAPLTSLQVNLPRPKEEQVVAPELVATSFAFDVERKKDQEIAVSLRTASRPKLSVETFQEISKSSALDGPEQSRASLEQRRQMEQISPPTVIDRLVTWLANAIKRLERSLLGRLTKSKKSSPQKTVVAKKKEELAAKVKVEPTGLLGGAQSSGRGKPKRPSRL